MTWSAVSKPITLYSMSKGLLKTLECIGLNYMLFGKGWAGTQGPGERRLSCARAPTSTGRTCSRSHTVLAIMQDHGKVSVEKATASPSTFAQLRPGEPRGRVGFTSAPPTRWTIRRSSPTTRLRRGGPAAGACCAKGVKMMRKVAEQGRRSRPTSPSEYAPGAAVQTDAEIDAWIKKTADTIYHLVGTCRMGVAGDP